MGAREEGLWSIWAISAILVLSGCGAVNPTIVDPIISAVDSSVSDRVQIDFGSYFEGEWDELGIVCAFTTNDNVEEGLGFAWPGAPPIDSHDRNLLVFTNEDQVIAWTEVPSRISFCTYGSESTDGIRIVRRADGQVTLVRTKVDDPIGTYDEYWLVDPESVVVKRSALEGVPVP